MKTYNNANPNNAPGVEALLPEVPLPEADLEVALVGPVAVINVEYTELANERHIDDAFLDDDWLHNPITSARNLETYIHEKNHTALGFIAYKGTEVSDHTTEDERTAEQWLWYHIGARATSELLAGYEEKILALAIRAAKKFHGDDFEAIHVTSRIERGRQIVQKTVGSYTFRSNSNINLQVHQALNNGLKPYGKKPKPAKDEKDA